MSQVLLAVFIIKSLPIDQGVSPCSTNTTVRTPKGTLVNVTYYSPSEELTQETIDYLNSDLDSVYHLATRKSPASIRYNCHNYAWNSDNPRGYDMLSPTAYMNDGSYYSVSTLKSGDRVFYPTKDHSAIYIRGSGAASNIIVESKWGFGGVYQHPIGYGPYCDAGIPMEYYRR